MRRLAVLALLALAGCGASAPSSVVPADATVYVGVSADEAERLLDFTSHEVDFERDVRPWLGERAAYFARGPDDYGLVLASDDDEQAERFAARVAVGGPLRASAVVDGYLVLASSRELLRLANAAEGGQALADSARLDVSGEEGTDILVATEDPRALARFDVVPNEAPAIDEGPVTARVRGDVVEVKGVPTGPAAPSLADLPGDATVAIASGDLSAEHVRAPFDVEALLRHAGAGTVAANGARSRIVAEVEDEAALRRALRAVARGLPRPRYHVDLDELEGGTLKLLASPRRLSRRHFLIEVGERLVVEVGETLGGTAEDLDDTARYQAAERRLGGPPTALIDDVAIREDGRGTLRISRAAG